MIQGINKKSNGKIAYGIWIVLFLLLFVCPIVGLLLSVLFMLKYSEGKKIDFYLFFITVAIFPALINSTKIPLSDYEIYCQHFLQAGEFSFFDYCYKAVLRSDILYSFLVYSLYHISCGTIGEFGFYMTFLIYLLLFHSIYGFLSHCLLDKKIIVMSVLIILFFTQYFNLTAHLIRQILAGSLLMCAISYKLIHKRNAWLVLGGACLVHPSSLFIAFISLIPILHYRLKWYHFLVLIFSIYLITKFNYLIASEISNDTPVGYALNRFSSNSTDGCNENIWPQILIVTLPMLCVCLYELYVKNGIIYGECLLCNLCITLILFVMMLYRSPLLQYRFLYYLYPFIPFVLPLVSTFRVGAICVGLVTIFFIFRFFVTFHNIPFQYDSLCDILITPIPLTVFKI